MAVQGLRAQVGSSGEERLRRSGAAVKESSEANMIVAGALRNPSIQATRHILRCSLAFGVKLFYYYVGSVEFEWLGRVKTSF